MFEFKSEMHKRKIQHDAKFIIILILLSKNTLNKACNLIKTKPHNQIIKDLFSYHLSNNFTQLNVYYIFINDHEFFVHILVKFIQRIFQSTSFKWMRYFSYLGLFSFSHLFHSILILR